MSKQVLIIGTTPNDGTGDSLRIAATKINANFDELYNATAASVNLISPGEGIATTNNLGNITITNSRPNKGTFKTIRVQGATESNVSTSDLEGELILTAGNNIVLAADNVTKRITISVNSIVSDNISGTFTGVVYGNVSGDVSGNLVGNVTSAVASVTDLRVVGNSGAVAAQVQILTSQKNSLETDINTLEGQISTKEDDLTSAENQLVYWQGQPPGAQRTQQIADYQALISTLSTELDGLNNTLLTKEDLLFTVNTQRTALIASQNAPYANLTYDAVGLVLSSDKHLDVPSITTQSPFVLTTHTTAERDDLDAVPGMIIFNLTDSKVQVWTGAVWSNLN